jgi:hypothetical protein
MHNMHIYGCMDIWIPNCRSRRDLSECTVRVL